MFTSKSTLVASLILAPCSGQQTFQDPRRMFPRLLGIECHILTLLLLGLCAIPLTVSGIYLDVLVTPWDAPEDHSERAWVASKLG